MSLGIIFGGFSNDEIKFRVPNLRALIGIVLGSGKAPVVDATSVILTTLKYQMVWRRLFLIINL